MSKQPRQLYSSTSSLQKQNSGLINTKIQVRGLHILMKNCISCFTDPGDTNPVRDALGDVTSKTSELSTSTGGNFHFTRFKLLIVCCLIYKVFHMGASVQSVKIN